MYLVWNYKIEARKDGYENSIKNVIIEENKMNKENIILQKGLEIQMNSDPQNADLYINNKYIGKTSQNIILKFGEHTIKLNAVKNTKKQHI